MLLSYRCEVGNVRTGRDPSGVRPAFALFSKLFLFLLAFRMPCCFEELTADWLLAGLGALTFDAAPLTGRDELSDDTCRLTVRIDDLARPSGSPRVVAHGDAKLTTQVMCCEQRDRLPNVSPPCTWMSQLRQLRLSHFTSVRASINAPVRALSQNEATRHRCLLSQSSTASRSTSYLSLLCGARSHGSAARERDCCTCWGQLQRC